jgi:hypothetical protein
VQALRRVPVAADARIAPEGMGPQLSYQWTEQNILGLLIPRRRVDSPALACLNPEAAKGREFGMRENIARTFEYQDGTTGPGLRLNPLRLPPGHVSLGKVPPQREGVGRRPKPRIFLEPSYALRKSHSQ